MVSLQGIQLTWFVLGPKKEEGSIIALTRFSPFDLKNGESWVTRWEADSFIKNFCGCTRDSVDFNSKPNSSFGTLFNDLCVGCELRIRMVFI